MEVDTHDEGGYNNACMPNPTDVVPVASESTRLGPRRDIVIVNIVLLK